MDQEENKFRKSVKGIMKIFLIDKEHSNTFPKKDLKILLEENEFRIIKRDKNGYFPRGKRNCYHPVQKKRLKLFCL